MFARDEKMNIKFTVVSLTQTFLMKDQVEFLKSMDITAKFIGEDQREKEA